MTSNNPLFHDPLIRNAEKSRLLIARRNNALESLGLSEAETDRLESELRTIGWPEYLADFAFRQAPANKYQYHPWGAEEERALLCINRHAKAGPEPGHFRAEFFPARTTITDQLNRVLKRPIGSWDHDDTQQLVNLYRNGKSFAEIVDENFQNSAVEDLEIVYGIYDRTEKTSERRKAASGMKSKSSRRRNAKKANESDDDEDEGSAGEDEDGADDDEDMV